MIGSIESRIRSGIELFPPVKLDWYFEEKPPKLGELNSETSLE